MKPLVHFSPIVYDSSTTTDTPDDLRTSEEEIISSTQNTSTASPSGDTDSGFCHIAFSIN